MVGDEYIFLEKYVDAKTKIKCKHNISECGHEWDVKPNGFVDSGTRCPKCCRKNKANRPKKSNEVFFQEIFNLVGDEYIFLESYNGAHKKILCKHKKCGHEWKATPNYFINSPRCPKCAINNNKKTNEEFIENVFQLVGDEYVFLEDYINSRTKIKCKHNTCGYEWSIIPNNFINHGQRCPKCNGNYRRSNEEFIQEVYELVGNEYIFLDEFIDTQTKIRCKHNIEDCENEWEISPSSFLRGTRCPKCQHRGYKKTDKEFKEEVYKLVGEEYEFLEKYIDAHTKIMCKHNDCNHKWMITPGKFLQGRRCPVCNDSKGEQLIREYLQNKKIIFLQEYTFSDLLSDKDNPLRFDFAVFNKNNDLKFLIEYDGEFHYQDIYKDGSYELQKLHDERKNQYCKENNIPLLRIPYWEFDNIEEILHKELHRLEVRVA